MMNTTEKRFKPPNLRINQRFDVGTKLTKTGMVVGGTKRGEWKGFKEWKAVSHSVSILFNGKKLSTHEFEKIYGIVSSWTNAEIESGDPMYDLYQESILKRGMIILREDIKEKHGKTLLNKLADVWLRFYGGLLPMLQIIFNMMTTRGLNIRQLTLQNFRDVVLLKTEAKEAIFEFPNAVPPPVKQMLLVLMSVHDNPHPSENYLKLEEMASKVVVPLLGAKTLYLGERRYTREKADSIKSPASKSPNSINGDTDSPRSSFSSRKLHRPFSMVDPSPSEKDPDFDELIQYRRQQHRHRYSYDGRLSAVGEEGKQSLASSFGSLIDD